MLIVNADDFGHSDRENEAIVTCFQEGVISSTTLMANMPGFESACVLARSHQLCHHIGVHINLTEGAPLTAGVRSQSKFCDSNGVFHFQRLRHVYLTPTERAALEAEVTAQIERCQEQGFALTHADSHHHAHTELPVFAIVDKVLRRHGIRNVRATRNVGSMSTPNRIYKRFFNSWIRWRGFGATDYFGDIDGYEAMTRDSKTPEKKSFEIMVHPGLDADNNLVDTTTREPLIPRLKQVLNGAQLDSYPCDRALGRANAL